MEIIETNMPGLIVLKPRVFEDGRGYFYESYNQQKLLAHDLNIQFVQDNQSKSSRGVIRGLHFQNPPHAQTKLVRALQGEILDVAVDIRKGSPTYGHWHAELLSEENKLQMLVPKGFAHGFSVLSDTAVVFYKCDDFYHPETEGGILFNDTDLAIDWNIPMEEALVSEKDKKLSHFREFSSEFKY